MRLQLTGATTLRGHAGLRAALPEHNLHGKRERLRPEFGIVEACGDGVNGGPPELDHRLVNGGQSRPTVSSRGNPVEPGNDNVFRNSDPALVEHVQHSKRHLVISANHGNLAGGFSPTTLAEPVEASRGHQLLSNDSPALPSEVTLQHLNTINNARRHCILEPLQPLNAVRRIPRPSHIKRRRRSMRRKHMPHQSPHPRPVTCGHMVELINPLAARQHDHGYPSRDMGKQFVRNGPGQNRQPVNPPGNVVNQSFPRGASPRGNHQRKPTPPGLDFSPAQNLVEVEVLDLDLSRPIVYNYGHFVAGLRIPHGWPVHIVMPRKEQPDDVGAAGGEAASVPAGHVPEKPHRFHDPLAGIHPHRFGCPKHP